MSSRQSVEVTHTAIFTTLVTGVGSDDFTYQWRHNGAIISGETEDTLMISNVTESDSGDFECIVTNQFGDTDISDVVVLVVTSKPGIVKYVAIYYKQHFTIQFRNPTCFHSTSYGHNN